jgi:hypothetical protein
MMMYPIDPAKSDSDSRVHPLQELLISTQMQTLSHNALLLVLVPLDIDNPFPMLIKSKDGEFGLLRNIVHPMHPIISNSLA